MNASVHHGRDHFDHQRLYCSDCGQALAARQPDNDQEDSSAIFALTHFENLLRTAIAGESVLVNGRYSVPGESVLRFVEDMAWALMRPLEGSPHRLLHIVQRSAFRVPFAFNTPADVQDWLSCGSLLLRRSILAVMASLLLEDEIGRFLSPADHSARPMWLIMKSQHCLDDSRRLRNRAELWHCALQKAVGFYW